MTDARAFYPATMRNREPILDVLRRHVRTGARVLEIASGSGEHAVFFADALEVDWQPTDPSPEACASIDAWRVHESATRVAPAMQLDVETRPWPVGTYDAVVCINMIHIAPWSATESLFAELPSHLNPNGLVFLYGPYKRGGCHTAPSNESFDESLRARNPAWGVRDLDDVTSLAKRHGLQRVDVVAMPANNLSVVFRL